MLLLAAQSNAQWIQTNSPMHVNILSFTANNNNLYVGTDGNGIYCSNDNGTSWTAINSGLTNYYVPALAICGNKIIAGTIGGVFLSNIADTNWIAVNSDLTHFNVMSLAVNDSNIYAGTATYINPYPLFYGGRVYFSTNYGSNWSDITSDLPSPSSLVNIGIYALAVKDTDVFVGTGAGVFRSTNNGTSWTSLNSGLTNSWVNALAFNGSDLIAGTRDGVFLSTNSGLSWTAIDSGLSCTYVQALAVNDDKFFVGTLFGVFLSTNNGTNWIGVNSGLSETNILSLMVSATNVYVGTFSEGVWKRSLSEIVTSVSLASYLVPKDFDLHQNYPNPFNSTTIISFTLPIKSLVSLKVFDIMGREIATLVSRELSAGSYSKQWNAEYLSSGVYFYRLQAGGSIATKKLLLLK